MTATHLLKNHPRKNELKLKIVPVLKEITNNLYDTAKDFESVTLPFLKEIQEEYGLSFDISLMIAQPLVSKWQINITTDVSKLKDFYSQAEVDEEG